mgnify:CR=1 FL=1
MNSMVATMERIRDSLNPRLEIAGIVLTMFDDDDSLFGAVRSGARGYVLKDSDGKELLTYDAVTGDLQGTSWKVNGVNTGNAVSLGAEARRKCMTAKCSHDTWKPVVRQSRYLDFETSTYFTRRS